MLQAIGGRTIQHSLDVFFCTILDIASFARIATTSAICQARQKISASVFVALNVLWQELIEQKLPCPRWRGFRLMAADGSCINLPASPEMHKVYGDGPNNDAKVLMARAMALYSIAQSQITQIAIHAYKAAERDILIPMLQSLKADDLLILDRGFPALWLFGVLHNLQRHFCMRADSLAASYIKAFIRSNKNHDIITLKLHGATRKRINALGMDAPLEISLRLVRVILPSGKIEVLVTSLLDPINYPTCEFKALYHQRWNIEEAFKVLKQRLHLEGFLGLSPLAIEQEIHAKILMANMAQTLCLEAQGQLPDRKQHAYHTNCAHAVSSLPKLIACWIKYIPSAFAQILSELLHVLSKTLLKIRPNRNYPRKHRTGGAARPNRTYRT